MRYTEYNQVCSKCDSPIEYKELGRSILITPCPCQTVELVKACKLALKYMPFQDARDIIEDALANATK